MSALALLQHRIHRLQVELGRKDLAHSVQGGMVTLEALYEKKGSPFLMPVALAEPRPVLDVCAEELAICDGVMPALTFGGSGFKASKASEIVMPQLVTAGRNYHDVENA